LKLLLIVISLFVSIHGLTAQDINLSGSWKFKIGDQSAWSTKSYNDASWSNIKVPSTWEDQGYHGYDGFAWYRKTFDGKSLNPNKKYYLNLGYIDDTDEVYVNGELIGFSGSMPPYFRTAYKAERNYVIPSDLIDYNGKNVIAVRVYDLTLQGGILDGDIGIYRYDQNNSPLLVDLRGIWDFATVKNERPPAHQNWDQIMVPSHWEKQGYRKYDGLAWYRKTFRLDENYKDLVLLLGRIDDFDEVYINGRLIGRTNDGRRLGRSESYHELRVYSIPDGFIKKGQTNTIEVLVEDMGIDGGIYEGPIGVTTRSRYLRYFR